VAAAKSTTASNRPLVRMKSLTARRCASVSAVP
jgi:hypothetical protein